MRRFLSGLFLLICRAMLDCLVTLDTARAGLPDDPAADVSESLASLLGQFCFDCHGRDQPAARLSLVALAEDFNAGEQFREWRKVRDSVFQGEMPPPDASQPTDAQRAELVSQVRRGLATAAKQHASEPGRTVIRRLTGAEFACTIEDLTGLDIDLDRDFVGDAAGGEGFTNAGATQFFQDSTLQWYLDAATRVADHAVIGAGPLQFHDDPKTTGLELSAIARIQKIYRDYGFRALSGEGGEPFGMDCYPKSFLVTWRYRYREQRGMPGITLAELAAAEGLTQRFVEHIWSLVTDPAPGYPLSEVVDAWSSLPTPEQLYGSEQRSIEQACNDVYAIVQQWHMRLIRPTNNAEDAPVLNLDLFNVTTFHSFAAPLTQRRVGGGGLVQKQAALPVRFQVISGTHSTAESPFVIWRNAKVRIRRQNREPDEEYWLRELISEKSAGEIGLGADPPAAAADPPDGTDSIRLTIGENDFVMGSGQSGTVEVSFPDDARGVDLLVDAEIVWQRSTKISATDGQGDVGIRDEAARDGFLRAEITQLVAGDSDKENGLAARSWSAVLAIPDGNAAELWRHGIQRFADTLPFVSHREAAPSDRDPIPPPFDNAYNMPERDWFHIYVKYHRDDSFLFHKILDDDTRERLEEAWADLLTSCDHHDHYLMFTCDKFGINRGERNIREVDEHWIAVQPEPASSIIARLHSEYLEMKQELLEARPRHLEDTLEFTSRAWRRPLSTSERERLLAFYQRQLTDSDHDHPRALRALLARILVSPEFLYRAERPTAISAAPVSDWELAGRLSFFLWSSVPDDELRSAAAAGKLHAAEILEHQTRRMLRDPRARRLASEFFGQWLGFYQFDRYAGIDHQQFPEFTEKLRQAMLDEATQFCEHLIRDDRPVQELLFADYGFLNAELAEHYRIPGRFSADVWQHVEEISDRHRGGVLGLGAVLVANSGAPQRTSPVRRGDWVLRRLLGTPVPPPPADAGSIPPEEMAGDGQTVRQRLEAHRRQPACMGCHSRIDPLGFALEHFDSLGRRREKYLDGQPIDASGQLTNGRIISGWHGLRKYLQEQSQQIERTLCTKLVGYATGRAESISDAQLIDHMLQELKSDARFSRLIITIVNSHQFRYHPGTGAPLPDDQQATVETTVETTGEASSADVLRRTDGYSQEDRLSVQEN